MRWLTLLIVVVVTSIRLGAAEYDISFVAWNCDVPQYDTLLTVNESDSLNFVSTVPGEVTLFVYINGILIDTVAAELGENFLSHTVSTDTLITIHVWTPPGMCYGQNFHITPNVGIDEPEMVPVVTCNSLLNRIIILNTRFTTCMVYDITGKLLIYQHLDFNSLNQLYLPGKHERILIVMLCDDERECLTKKMIL